MNRTLVAGAVTVVLSTVGYCVGVVAPYPGRSLSIAGLMVGLTLLAVGGNDRSSTVDATTDGGRGSEGGSEP
jgi:hypothetical protein